MNKPKYPIKEIPHQVGKIKIDGKDYLVSVNFGRIRIFKEVVSTGYWAMLPIDEQVEKLVNDNEEKLCTK